MEEILASDETESPIPIVMKFFHAGDASRWPTQREEDSDLFPWVLSILSQEKQRETPFEKIAILVKDRYQAERVRRLLKRRGIDTLLKRGERVTDTKAYSWLKEALKVLLFPKKRQCYLDLLLSAPTKETMITAKRLKEQDDPFFFAPFVDEWQKGQKRYEKEGVGGLFSHILSCPLTERLTVSEWIQTLDDADQWMLDLEQLHEMMGESNKRHLCLEEVFDKLERLVEEYSDDESLLQRRSNPLSHAVTIVTMHSSKGLEFQVVILLGASVRSSLDPETCESVAEKIRQFYVSVTRAKERCYIPIPLFEKPGLSPIEAYFGASLLRECTEGISWSEALTSFCCKEKVKERVHDLVSSYPKLFSLSDEKVSYEVQEWPVFERKRNTARMIYAEPIFWTTYSALKGQRPPSLKIQKEKVEKSKGTLWGLRVHRALYEVLSKSTRPSSEEELLSFLPTWLVEEEGRDSFLREVWALLTTPLPLNLTPLELSPSSLHLEHAFYLLQESSQPLFGTFDMVIQHEGKVFVLDWKTNEEPSHLECQELSRFIEEEGYDVQASLYKKAALQLFPSVWGGFFFVFSKHRSCPNCHGVVSWNCI